MKSKTFMQHLGNLSVFRCPVLTERPGVWIFGCAYEGNENVRLTGFVKAFFKYILIILINKAYLLY